MTTKTPGEQVWVVVYRWDELETEVRVCATKDTARKVALAWLKSILPSFGAEHLGDKEEVQSWAKRIDAGDITTIADFMCYVSDEAQGELYISKVIIE